MQSIEPYINVIIALLGLAYPILLQVIARLDENYESENISRLFKTELEWKAFRYLLVASLISIVIWSLKLKPLIFINGLNKIIENSAEILVSFTAILLVVSFFFFVKKVIKYYTLYDLIPYIIECHENSDDKIKFISPISDLLLFSIKKQNTNFSRTLSDFFFREFRRIRDNSPNEPIIYPEQFYETVYRSIEELALLKGKRNYLLEHRTSGGTWLLGSLQGSEISEKTYSWLWKNLLIAVTYEKDDFIVNHWETCHQFLSYNLRKISPEYFKEIEGNFQVTNHEEIEKRDQERRRFLEFHYALGGLLTYKKKYECIHRLFTYTQSEPPSYELLPKSMTEIFELYNDFKDPYEINYPWISHQYPFPELGGIRADRVIKKWIISYFGILFLRQYQIIPYLIGDRPLGFPTIPLTQGKIRKWINGIDFFKRLVNEHLGDEVLLKILGLDFISKEWCIEHNKPYPTEFIELFKSSLEEAYDNNAINLQLSDGKIARFKESTRSILESSIEKLYIINNKKSIPDKDSDKWYVRGKKMLQSKDAFCENPEADHLNFDSFFADAISKNIFWGLGDCLLNISSKSYLIKSENLFKAVDQLEIDENYIIINLGINIEYIINQYNIEGLSEDNYKNIKIYSFSGSKLVRDSLFILNQTDLPKITTLPIEADSISKYTLEKLSENLEIYASVVDLNRASEEILSESIQHKPEDEIRRSVLLCIYFLLEFKWKKNIEVIKITENLEFLQRGIENSLKDIKPFKKSSD